MPDPSRFPSAPTHAEVIIPGPHDEPLFNPIWLNWFLKVAKLFTSAGGGSGSILHNSLVDLQGGTTDEYYHLTAAEHNDVRLHADAEVPAGAIPGTVYTLAENPDPVGSLQLFRNGVLQTAGGFDYTLLGNQITYVLPLAADDKHISWYRYAS